MVVARLGPTYIVKRMPGTGQMHAQDCDSHGLAVPRPPRPSAHRPAIYRDPQTGTTSIRIDCALTPRRYPEAHQSRLHRARDGPTRQARLSLQELLLFLWEQAGLTQWHPGFAGKRVWAVVRSHLLRAAEGKRVNGRELSQVLYAPEPFSVKRRQGIEERRRLRWAVPANNGRLQILLVVAEIKSLMPVDGGVRVMLKQLPDQRFQLSAPQFELLRAGFAPELELWHPSAGIRMAMIAAMEVDLNGSGRITECGLVPFDQNWLPVTQINCPPG